LYGDLLKARREWPALREGSGERRAVVAERDEGGCLLRYERGGLLILFNMSRLSRGGRLSRESGFSGGSGHPRAVETGRILWTSEAAAYGGRRAPGSEKAAGAALLPYEVVAIASAE
jgi:hypothetical protein